MFRNILIPLIFTVSFLFTQEIAGKASDLTFNIPHTKSKADVYKTLINFFKKNGEQYNCKIGSYKNFKKGTFDVFTFYKCDTVSKSYKLTIIVGERNVKLNYNLPKEKNPDAKCISRTYDSWIELKDVLANTIDPLKDAATSSIPPDVPVGSGFKNIPFGVGSDSVNSLLQTSGYIEGDNQVSLHPKFHEYYYQKDTTNDKKSFILIIKIGSYITKVRLGFTPDDKFYLFKIELPSRTADYFKNVKEKDCLFLTDVFKKKYGEPDTTFSPEINDVSPLMNTFVGMWEKDNYTAYTALSLLDAKYFTVGIVKSKPLEEAFRKHQKKENEKRLKGASESF